MKNIYLIRHCKAEGQHPAAELTSDGRSQAERLAGGLMEEHITFVISSPYVRAINTAKPLCERLNIGYQTDDRLKERVLSIDHDEGWLDKLKNTYIDMDLKYSGGESSNEAMQRGMEVVHEMIGRPDANIAIVTHGALMSLILKYFDSGFGFEEWKKLSNPDIYKLTFNRDGTTIRRIWQ